MSKKVNKSQVAENFVITQDYITRMGLSKAFAKNPIEKAARESLLQEKIKLNSFRLLVLTGNLTDDEFFTKANPVYAEIEKLEKIVHAE